MNKRHFIAIARAFADTRPRPFRQGDPNNSVWLARCNQWRASVDAMVDVCKMFNPHFDRIKFIRDCDE